jgi:hypothetical protein
MSYNHDVFFTGADGRPHMATYSGNRVVEAYRNDIVRPARTVVTGVGGRPIVGAFGPGTTNPNATVRFVPQVTQWHRTFPR